MEKDKITSEDIFLNETKKIILRIFLGNKKPLSREDIMRILNAYYTQIAEKENKTPKTAKRTTIYDNLYPLEQMGIISKKTYPNNVKKRGRSIVKWVIDNHDLATQLLEKIVNETKQ